MSAERRLFAGSAAPGAWLRGGSLEPGVIDEIQRGRIFESLLAVTQDREVGKIAVQHILHPLHMSTRTFYAYFETREDCLRAAYLALAERLGADLTDACAAAANWPSAVRASIAAALAFAAAEPLAARFLAHGVMAAGAEAAAAQAESIDALAAKLREGRDHHPQAARLNRHTERVLVAGLVALLGERLREGGVERLEELAPELVEVVLAPYLGLAEARRLARA